MSGAPGFSTRLSEEAEAVMATDTDKKLYVALAVLAVLGGTLLLVQ